MNLRPAYLSIVIILCLSTSCKKHTKKDIGPHTDIYMAGSISKYYSKLDKRLKISTAVYWKNGVQVQLTDSLTDAYTTGIAVNKNDIYVIGGISYWVNNYTKTSKAVYWKNGILTQLGEGTIEGIAIKGNDVYMVGSTWGKGQDQAIFWKNSKAFSLGKGRLTSIYIDDDDIYIAGFRLRTFETPGIIYGRVDTNYYRSPTYWKNGAAITLNDSIGTINSMFVQDGNVYAAGSKSAPYEKAVYWKNGRLQDLVYKPHPMGAVSGITTDEYGRYMACGNIYVGHNNYIAVSWENGRLKSLPHVGETSDAKAISILGKDIYIVGSNQDHPVYWKNGNRVEVGKDKGDITSITLVNY